MARRLCKNAVRRYFNFIHGNFQMNPALDDSHPSIRFYDSDYPSPVGPHAEENFDETVKTQGLAKDIDRYRALAGDTPKKILDLCTGTGRIGIPLAQSGHKITAVDISAAMLEKFSKHLEFETEETTKRITLHKADISQLSLDQTDYELAIIGFNSLMCIPDFAQQQSALSSVSKHLAPGGVLALDLMNPHAINVSGDDQPKPFFTRRRPGSGKLYTRFAMVGPMDADQCQELSGWYDEYDDDGAVRREFYSMEWRIIYRFELELMLVKAGFEILSVEGGHELEPFDIKSRKMFVIAQKRS